MELNYDTLMLDLLEDEFFFEGFTMEDIIELLEEVIENE